MCLVNSHKLDGAVKTKYCAVCDSRIYLFFCCRFFLTTTEPLKIKLALTKVSGNDKKPHVLKVCQSKFF